MHLPPLIHDLAIILAAAAVITMIFKKIKQPVVLGYIIAGICVSPNVAFVPTITDGETIKIWAEIGVIFLLFALGLEFSFKKLTSVGGSASIIGVVEVAFMLGMGYLVGRMIGWNEMDSLFLGGVLSISSTTIIIRAFEEVGVKSKKFASLVFGVLIVEDLVAILLLVLLSTIAVSVQFKGEELIFSSFKLVFFLVIWFLSGILLVPTLLRKTKHFLNNEMTLILSIGLCLIMVLIATQVGFSPALGAFIMGSILAETSEGKRIEHLIEPVKNLFAAVFFVSVGMLLDPQMLVEHWEHIVIITLLTIVGKIFSSGLGALISGQTIKNSIQTGFSLAQIGEFSFIIATLGLTLNVTSDFLYPITVAVSVITTFTTPYLIKSSEGFAHWFEKILPHKFVESIYRYSSSTQAAAVSSKASRALKEFMMRLFISVIILIAMSILTKKIVTSFIFRHFGENGFTLTVSFMLIFASTSPFFWALIRGKINQSLVTFGSSRRLVFLPYALSFFRYVIVAIVLGFQISLFFSTTIGAFVFLILLTIAVLSFSKHIGKVYDWFEKIFMGNLNQSELAVEESRSPTTISPWDSQLVKYQISPNFLHAGSTLQELAIREKYGVSVVIIERGDFKIKAPKHHEALFPNDTVSVIGTEDQLNSFKDFLETSHPAQDAAHDNYVLKGCTISEESEYLGKTIRESGIREFTDGLVVGLERNARRILNPDPLIVLEVNDLLWIVGNDEKLKKIK
jgi:CPA2 family monovalent cation:H+ antiporter-2